MIRTRLALALLAAVAALPAYAHGQDVSKVNGGITVEAGEQYGALDTVNGGINIGANARVSSAETVNGGIEVGAGAQTGSLETVNGGIRMEENVTTSGGVAVAPSELERVTDHLGEAASRPARWNEHRLWEEPIVYLLLLGMLATEWWHRRRRGLP